MDKLAYKQAEQIGGWLDSCPNNLPIVMSKIAALIPEEVSELVHWVRLDIVKGAEDGIICWKLRPGPGDKKDLYGNWLPDKEVSNCETTETEIGIREEGSSQPNCEKGTVRVRNAEGYLRSAGEEEDLQS